MATKPPIIGTAVTAWKDAFSAIGAMPVVAGIALVLVLITSLGSLALVPDPYEFADSPWLVAFLIGSSILQAVLLAPLAIAVHRFVILGERATRYPLEPGNGRYLRFVGFAILVKLLWLIPSAIQKSMPDAEEKPGLAAGLGFLVLILFIVIVIVVVRRVILFPAIAIDAPGATWHNARTDTKGSSWRVAFIFVLTAVPLMVILGPVYWLLLMPPDDATTADWMIYSLIGSVVAVPALCAFAAAASRIYQARAEVLAKPST